MSDTVPMSERQQVPAVVRGWMKVLELVQGNLGGFAGPEFIPQSIVINLQKGGTLLFCLYLMKKFNKEDSTEALVYTAMHGSYGLAWLLKELVFPDPKWERKLSIFGAANSALFVLLPYWAMPYLLIANPDGHSPRTPQQMLVAIIVYVLGLVTMVGADCQKYFVLKAKKGLITDGFFRRVRHPNYLGEMMLYGAFAYQSGYWQSYAVLAWVWSGLFLPNMLQKEASMSRYPQWAAYKKRSGFLIPKLF